MRNHGKNSLQWSVILNNEHVKHHLTTYMYNNSVGHYSSQTDQNTEKGPYWDPVPIIGTHLEAVSLNTQEFS